MECRSGTSLQCGLHLEAGRGGQSETWFPVRISLLVTLYLTHSVRSAWIAEMELPDPEVPFLAEICAPSRGDVFARCSDWLMRSLLLVQAI